MPRDHVLLECLTWVVVVPFGEAEWTRAAQAFRRYGRGRHRAALNFRHMDLPAAL